MIGTTLVNMIVLKFMAKQTELGLVILRLPKFMEWNDITETKFNLMIDLNKFENQ